jgi:hypothetical protein
MKPNNTQNKHNNSNMKDLEDLFGLLCKAMKNALESPNEDGEVGKVSPGVMQAVRAFLHDNQITAIPAEGSDLGDLVGAYNRHQQGNSRGDTRDPVERLEDEFVVPFSVRGSMLDSDDPAVTAGNIVGPRKTTAPLTAG